jgi:hypothetical protein
MRTADVSMDRPNSKGGVSHACSKRDLANRVEAADSPGPTAAGSPDETASGPREAYDPVVAAMALDYCCGRCNELTVFDDFVPSTGRRSAFGRNPILGPSPRASDIGSQSSCLWLDSSQSSRMLMGRSRSSSSTSACRTFSKRIDQWKHGSRRKCLTNVKEPPDDRDDRRATPAEGIWHERRD